MSNEQKDPYEPDWLFAPKNWPECWHAVDADGQGYFFQKEPTKYDYHWDDRRQTCMLSYTLNPFDWENSLRKRPAK